jgi:hypothetical protein
MKLNLIFAVMDLLTLAIYPFVFIHGGLLRFVKVVRLLGTPSSVVLD